MKTDDDSEEARKPPGNTSGKQKNPVSDANAEKEELQWVRRHAARGPAQCRESRPADTNAKTAARPAAAEAMFRKTELRNKPSIFRPEEPVVREKTLVRVMGQDAAIPYTMYEDALRTLTASFVQRQETIAGQLAAEIDELHDRIDILEDRIEMAIDHVSHRLSRLEKERES
jgi:hypothetical protein